MKRLISLGAVALLALPLAACGDDDDGGKDTLTVYAAASLTSTFEQLEKQFEKDHPDVDVKLDFDGSSSLVARITEGGGADVFASADTANMDKLVDADMADGDPVNFATNTLMIAVPPGNPAGIKGFNDLAKKGLNLVLCQPEVPCGSASQKLAEDVGVDLKPVSEYENVKQVLTAIEEGEADEGLVYVTDVTDAGDKVEGIAFDESDKAVNDYPIVAVDGGDSKLAQEWIDLVLGDGQKVLSEAGFGAPAS